MKRRRQRNPGTSKLRGRTLEFGPFRATEVGNEIVFESNWTDPGEHAAFIASWIHQKPKIKEEIDHKVERAKEIIGTHDPLEILTLGALEWSFTKIRESGERDLAEDFLAEYALGLCSAIPFDKPRPSPNEDTIQKFGELLRSLFTEVATYYGIEFASANQEGRPLVDLRVQALLRFLYQRGDTYRYYQYDFVRSLYAAHDQFFHENFGLGVADSVAAIKLFAEQGNLIIQSQQDMVRGLMRATEIVADTVANGTIPKTISIEEFRQQAQQLPGIKDVLPDAAKFNETLQRNPFELVIESPGQRAIAERLSINFGANSEFADFHKSPGWPTNSGLHTTHPLISHDGKFYAFVPQIIWRNAKEILDSWVVEASSVYFEKTVLDSKTQSGRANWLEREAVDLLSRLLPGGRVYRNVFYQERLGGGKRRELDGIIEFDRNVLLISAKSGQLSTQARRGAPSSMRDSVGALVVDGFEQGLSAKHYIETDQSPTFTDESGVAQITFGNDFKPRATYVVNITLAALGPLSIQLSALKKANLISATELPWSVFVNDLRVIADILQGPSEFLFYLQRRLRFNQFEQLHGAEELDLFAYFLDQGLFFDEEKLTGVSRFSIGSNTDELDQYFENLEKTPAKAVKPALAISPGLRKLISAIETIRCEGFSIATLYLLNLDGSYHQMIGENIGSLSDKVQQDHACHHWAMAFGSDFGMTLELRPDMPGEAKLENYSRLKKYQLKVPNWLYVSISADFVRSPNDTAIMFSGEWQFDAAMETVLSRFREIKLQQAVKGGRKIGRNAQCPCGSGEKFKNCCGKPS
jgi:hypothetical protein